MNSFQEGIYQNHQILLGRGEGYNIFFQEGCVIFQGIMFIYFVIAVGAGCHDMPKWDILFDWIIAQLNFCVLEYALQQFFKS